jgi:hypothetical protein
VGDEQLGDIAVDGLDDRRLRPSVVAGEEEGADRGFLSTSSPAAPIRDQSSVSLAFFLGHDPRIASLD